MKQLWDYFASYPYLPRLRDSTVLIECIREGLRSRDFFGYASSMDNNNKYLGLEFGNPGAMIVIDAMSLLIKKESALEQVLEEEQKQLKDELKVKEATKEHQYKSEREILQDSKIKQFKRFYGRVDLDSMRLSRDAGLIAEEVIQHLATLPSSDVKISLEITANTPDGIPEKIVRVLLENCKTLKFNVNDFEE